MKYQILKFSCEVKMSIATIPDYSHGPAVGIGAVPLSVAELYRMNVSEYERLVSLGALEDPRIELIDGYLVRKMGKNPPHVWSVDATEKVLQSLLPAGWIIRRESPVRIPEFDEPEPDIAVVKGSREDYKTRHPDPVDIGLLVEVAESSLDRDRGKKLQAYARSGIPVYWIVNLIDERIEIYTDPTVAGYETRQDYPRGTEATVVVDGIERGRVRVDDLLP
jgi:Uma2 family endonuclease